MYEIIDEFLKLASCGINDKHIQDVLEIIDHQRVVLFGDCTTRNVLLSLKKKQIPACFLMSQAYSYGVMDGKRMERARRKAVQNPLKHRRGISHICGSRNWTSLRDQRR